ncbi:hypothetical protein [Candidatus Stoquefichus massiliensis]|uniref:hypothetical protein n=1 Tax=Candidatus Stoquefichus massiliensis TaxID=1470350 RepID=UPI0004BA7052|nr:hypothetical protein [Candidatus Stoquefichus massiliensis]
MKKSTLLSLATAGAIVATSAFTFAAWDTLNSTEQVATVTIRNPVTVKVTEDTATQLSTTNALNELPEYIGTAKVKLSNATGSGYHLEAAAKVYNGEVDVTTKLDTKATVKTATLDDGDKEIEVSVKPKDDQDSKDLANKQLTVKVEAKLVKDSAE